MSNMYEEKEVELLKEMTYNEYVNWMTLSGYFRDYVIKEICFGNYTKEDLLKNLNTTYFTQSLYEKFNYEDDED